MWSFEKIHRCIAHLFLGELVATFDEEFRILFAQSQPLVVENSLVPMPPDSTSGYLSNQFGLKRSQSLRNPRGFLRHPELLGYPFGGDRLDTPLPFRREDSFRHSLEPGGVVLQASKYISHQTRMQQSFLEQGRPIITSRQLESNSYKRHSYAEGTRESYSSSRQYMKQRVMNNLDEMEAHYQRDQQFYQSECTGPETGRFDSLRSSSLYQLDQYSDPVHQAELESPDNHSVLSSEDLGHDPESRLHQGMARFGQSNQKRPTLSHAYACQSSPTQLHPLDHKQMFAGGEQGRQSQDPSVKQGLRSWRINSYLNTYENNGEEGLQQPLGPDAFDEPQQQQQPESRQYNPEVPGFCFNTQEPPAIKSKPKLDLRLRFGKPILPDRKQAKDVITDQASAGTDSQKKSAITATPLTSAETDSEKEMDLKDSKNVKEISITKHESFRSRINPVLQRSSRLRSSLIFSSSKVEQHSSAVSGDALQEDDENNPIRTSSIVAEILEKRKSFSREPFDWNKHKKKEEKDSKEVVQEEVTSKTEQDPPKNTDEIKAQSKNPGLEVKDITKHTEPALPKPTSITLDMNDPASRLQYFKELSIKRKNSKTEKALNTSQEPRSKKPDIQPSTAAVTVSSVSVTPANPLSTTATSTVTSTATSTVTSTVTSSTTTTVQTDSAEKPFVVITKSGCGEEKLHMDSSVLMEESTDAAKKETAKEPKFSKPFPSPKFSLKPFKSSHTRHTSCGDDILTDATDAEKSELKKSRSLSSSTMPQTESKESFSLSRQGSNMSLNVIGSESKDTKALDFLKKQTQRLKGFLGPKGEKKNSGGFSTADDKQMKTVPEASVEASSKGKETHSDSVSASTTDNSKSINKPSPSRYQSSTSTVLFSSNLRDDTKVILEKISANSQKNRQELAKQADETGNVEGEKGGHVSNLDREPVQRFQNRNRFNRAQVNPQERDSLLKRIESMRKEKKVYSRFEVVRHTQD